MLIPIFNTLKSAWSRVNDWIKRGEKLGDDVYKCKLAVETPRGLIVCQRRLFLRVKGAEVMAFPLKGDLSHPAVAVWRHTLVLRDAAATAADVPVIVRAIAGAKVGPAIVQPVVVDVVANSLVLGPQAKNQPVHKNAFPGRVGGRIPRTDVPNIAIERIEKVGVDKNHVAAICRDGRLPGVACRGLGPLVPIGQFNPTFRDHSIETLAPRIAPSSHINHFHTPFKEVSPCLVG